jgi:hypothetical protein
MNLINYQIKLLKNGIKKKYNVIEKNKYDIIESKE